MSILHKIVARPKYYFVFPIVVVAMLSANFMPVHCPVCDGVGLLEHSVGMKYVKIISVDSRIWSYTQDACTSYIVVKAGPIITVSNTSQDVADGYLILRLIDLDSHEEVSMQYLHIEVPANARSDIDTYVVFAYISSYLPPERMEIKAEVLLDTRVPCIACDGKGSISLNIFPVTQAYKNEFTAIIRGSTEYLPIGENEEFIPGIGWVVVGSQEWLDAMELQ